MQALSEWLPEGAARVATWHRGITAKPPWRTLLSQWYGDLHACPVCTGPAHPVAESFPVQFPSLQAWKARSYQTLLSVFLRLSTKHLSYILENPLTLSQEKPKRKPIAGENPGFLESRDRNKDHADRPGGLILLRDVSHTDGCLALPLRLIKKTRWAWKHSKPRKRAEDITTTTHSLSIKYLM